MTKKIENFWKIQNWRAMCFDLQSKYVICSICSLTLTLNCFLKFHCQCDDCIQMKSLDISTLGSLELHEWSKLKQTAHFSQQLNGKIEQTITNFREKKNISSTHLSLHFTLTDNILRTLYRFSFKKIFFIVHPYHF